MGSETHFNESEYWQIIHQRIKCVFSFTVLLRANGYQIYIFLISVNTDGCMHLSIFFRIHIYLYMLVYHQVSIYRMMQKINKAENHRGAAWPRRLLGAAAVEGQG